MENLKNFQFRYAVYDNALNIHNHSYAQMLFPIEGNLYIETGKQRINLQAEDIFFLPPNCRHIFAANGDNTFLVLDIPLYMIHRDDMNKINGGIRILPNEKWKAIKFLLLDEINGDNASHQSILDLFRYSYNMLLFDTLPNSIRYIHEHFNEIINLDILAKIENYSIAYYCEWFKKQTGVTLTNYIKKLRVSKAKDLLLNTNYSILQIAQQVGYEHHSSLTRVFLEYEKLTPKEYRKSIQKPAK